MKKIVSVILGLIFFSSAFCDTKMVDSTVDYPAALEQAKKENKVVLVVLSRTATCSLCVRFASNILENPAFKKYAKKNLIVVYIDRTKEKGYVVAEKIDEQKKAASDFFKKNPEYKTMPGVMVLDPESDEYQFFKSPEVASMKPSKFIGEIKKFKSKVDKAAQKNSTKKQAKKVG